MRKYLNKYLPLFYGAYFNTLSYFSTKKAAEKAFFLFCTPRKGKVREDQQDFLEEAKSERIKTNGVELQTYQWKGNKESVLLIHGWESNVYRWRNLISYLKKEGFNIIAFDGPAQGYSTGKVLNVPLYTECTQAIVDQFKPKYVIGHSMGGMTTLYHQEKYPNDTIEKIVTIGAPSDLEDIMDHYQRLLRFNDTVYVGLDEYLQDNYGFGIRDFSTSKFKGHLSKKGLVIHDKEDPIAPFIASEKVHAKWKNSDLYVTHGLGHSMHQDKVNLKIMDFLKS
ncbi:alpha/beta hydrolase [Maribacter sp. ANRC-HE7]|uniref:Alpha/beta hydrolase n=1 Tax=Maribacter aquimaris TaxID=2737171 RepID=A0ABR7V019_9FLAO|nr:alpha/beta hydrolase [Maribacter aquimaris]MBD0778123.1 alpha/beta hydrolase [Maribacter aquimaris]